MAGRRQTAKMELAIGATMIAAIIILLMMLFVWGGSSSLFSKHYWVVVEMSNVGGLREGAPVKIGGFEIGKVSSIQLRPGATELDIVLGIDENRLIPKGSSGKISTAGLVGDAFLEITPGRSTEMLARAGTVAEAERIPSSPVPDFSELLIRVEAIGTELNSLASHINDILGDGEFRQNVKVITANLATASREATTLLQRGQRVVDNVERATSNVAILSDTLKEKVDQVAGDIAELTGEAKGKVQAIGDNLEVITGTVRDRVDGITADVADVAATVKRTAENLDGTVAGVRAGVDDVIGEVKTVAASAKRAVDNLDGTITDARAGVNDVIGEVKTIAASTKRAVDNLDGTITDARAGVNDAIGEVKTIAASAKHAVDNLDGAISDARRGVNQTIGDPQLAADVRTAVSNVREVTDTLAAKRGDIEAILANLGRISGDLTHTATRVREVAMGVEPAKVTMAVDDLSGTIRKVSDMVEKILADPVLALSANKAADRIVKMKFDEMAKNNQARTSDEALREVRLWTGDALGRGHFVDPNYGYNQRPYAFDH